MLKQKILAFVDGLILYDYILFGASFVLFLLFIILALLLRKHLKTALFFVLLSFASLFLGPTLGYIELHKYLFKNSVTLTQNKRLQFTQAVVLKGVLKNESKLDFSECLVKASFYKVTQNKYKNYLLEFKPFLKKTMLLKDIAKGESRSFKMLVEPFTYSKEYNVSLGADCK